METNTCPNCNTLIDQNFCGNCGQKKYRRIDKKYLIEEFKYSILHVNKGFFFSIKSLSINPGKTARDYIDGIRTVHYKPILLSLILSGFAVFLSSKFLNLKEMMAQNTAVAQNEASKAFMSEFIEAYTNLITNYFGLIMLSLIPFFSIATWLIFRKWGHNYYEHFVMNTYIQCFNTIVSILLYIPMYIFKDNAEQISYISFGYYIFFPLILIWFYRGFYYDKPLGAIIGKSIVAYLLSLVVVGTVLTIVGGGYGVYFGLNHPEYFQHK